MYPRKLSYLNRESLRRIVGGAVARAMDAAQEGELVATLVAEIAGSLRREGRTIRGITRRELLEELQRENHELLVERSRAASELADLQSELDLHRGMLAEAHDAMVRRADQDGAVIDRGLRVELAALFDRAEAGELDLPALRRAVDEAVTRAATESRGKMLDAWADERDRQVDLLERRIAKLNRSLAASEEAIRMLAAKAEEDPGVASLYRTVQGLDPFANAAAQKRIMLAEIYKANLELRRGRQPA